MQYPIVLCHTVFISIWMIQFRSVAQSCPTLRPHGLQHARPPCPSPTPGLYSHSCPWSRWCHPAISSSVSPFSSWELCKNEFFLEMLSFTGNCNYVTSGRDLWGHVVTPYSLCMKKKQAWNSWKKQEVKWLTPGHFREWMADPGLELRSVFPGLENISIKRPD